MSESVYSNELTDAISLSKFVTSTYPSWPQVVLLRCAGGGEESGSKATRQCEEPGAGFMQGICWRPAASRGPGYVQALL